MRILVADDEALVRELLTAALEDSGAEVCTANDGCQAVVAAESQQPDLILIDLVMPGMSGMDALRQLKSQPATADIPVIVLTAGATRANVCKAFSLGATDFISKSGFHLQILIERLLRIPPLRKSVGPPVCAGDSDTNHEEVVSATGAVDPDVQIPGAPAPPPIGPVFPPAPSRRSTTGGTAQQPVSRRQIDAMLRNAAEPGALPFVVSELIGLTSSTRTSVQRLSEVIRRDPALTIRIIKLANSAFYSEYGPAQNLNDAIKHLGFREIKHVALTIKIMERYRDSELPQELDQLAFWRHAIACGALTKRLAALSVRDEQRLENAFLVGLLHDIGKAVLSAFFPEQYQHAISSASADRVALHEREILTFGMTHTDVAGQLLPRWGFPDDLIQAVVLHHTEWESLQVRADPALCRLIACAQLANTLAKVSREGSAGSDYLEAVPESLATSLSVDRDVISRMLIDLKRQVQDLSMSLMLYDDSAIEEWNAVYKANPGAPEIWYLHEFADWFDPAETFLRRSGCKVHEMNHVVSPGTDKCPQVVVIRPGSIQWLKTITGQMRDVFPQSGTEHRFVVLTDCPHTPEIESIVHDLGDVTQCRPTSVRDLEEIVAGRPRL